MGDSGMSYLIVPPTLYLLAIPRAVLCDTWELLRGPGGEGLEATVLWPGRVLDDTRGEVLSAYRPEQIAYRSALGLSVAIPPEALTDLVTSLPLGIHFLARVHTHPGVAYHSEVDDGNLIIGHVGAISIVVPDFAVGPPSLDDCSINRLAGDGSWRELSEEETSRCLQVI
jgi:proteasome lid subunit RPN8/RPN11